MSKGNIRHMFPGGNTSQGFFSYYDYILPQDEARRIFVIKGGPGVGKSTFMKKIADEMLDRGFNAEFMHCSSDNNSLDGVVFPQIKVALLDGTAPHVVDPKNPGVVDEIIHLGDYWDEKNIVKNKKQVMDLNRQVGKNFARAYRYIKAASLMYLDNVEIYSQAVVPAKVNALTNKVLEDIGLKKGVSIREGKERKLFASAITPDGYKNYLDTVLNTDIIYEIKGFSGTGTEKLLERVKAAALERGYDAEAYYCALFPSKLEHMVIPELNTSLTTSNEYHEAKVCIHTLVDFDMCMNKNILNSNSEVIEYNKDQFNNLMESAHKTIKKAKSIHDDMEKYYVSNMDFEAVQRCCESTLARILEYAE